MAKGGIKRARVLIIGAGFGGLAAAKVLSGRAEVEVTLVDKARTHVFYPLLYEVAAGLAHGDDLDSEATLTKGVSFPYAQILKRWGCGYVHAAVTGIDPVARTVRTSDGEDLPYDYLVAALGFETDFFGIPNLAERALRLNSLDDALAIRRRILDFLEKKQRGAEVSLRIMVGGGGATGVEIAAELANFFRSLERRGRIHSGDWSLQLVESSPRLLSMLPPEGSAHALRRLEKLGVKVMLDTCFKRVEERHVILAPRPLRLGESPEALVCEFRAEAERAFEAEIVIWCGGSRGNAAAGLLGLPLDRKGRIAVEPTLAAAGLDRVFVVGDCAALVDPENGKPVPQLAQSAIEMGRLAAANVLRLVQGRSALPFRFRAYPAVIPLGGTQALANFGKWRIGGFAGWSVRQAATLLYCLSILPPLKAWHVFVRGAVSYLSND